MGLLLQPVQPWDAGSGDTSNYSALKTTIAALQSKDAVVLYFDGVIGPTSMGNTPYAFYVWSVDFGTQSLIWTSLNNTNASAKPGTFSTDFPNAVQVQQFFNTPLWG